MLLRCAVLLLYLMVASIEVIEAGLTKSYVSDSDARYSLWPSIHHGVRMMRLRKREAATATNTILKPDALPGQSVQPNAQADSFNAQADISNGQAVKPNSQADKPNAQAVPPNAQAVPPNAQAMQEAHIHSEGQSDPENLPKPSAEGQPSPVKQTELPAVSTQVPASPKKENNEVPKPQTLDNNTVHKTLITTGDNSTVIVGNKTSESNVTAAEPSKINLSDPGVMKRASIVFGGFALLATAYYFIIYRKKGNNNDAKNTHSSIDQNQFRYGVLESEDKRSNMELSSVPLTMESDEDDDEDLEIFDLGQKKRSLSYINLEQNDEDIVLNDSRSVDMENLLVDIEDKNSDMINWSGNGSKSIL